MDTIPATFARRSWIAAAVAIVAVIALFFLPDIQDYHDYGTQWMQLVRGGNPWFDGLGHWNGNAYGPLHSILAWPFSWWHKLPRVFLVAAWVAVGLLLFRPGSRRTDSPSWLSLVLFWGSPYLWSEVVVYSHSDFFVAALCIAALISAERDQSVLSGILLAGGIALKLYPIVLLPFFAVRQGRLQWRWILSVAVTIGLIYGGAYLLWGPTVWQSLSYAAERGSSPFSIFYFLKSEGSPLRLFSASPDLDWLSLPLIVICGGIFWILYVRKLWTLGLGAIAAFCLVLVLYKVGHEQFEMFLYLGILLLWRRFPHKIPDRLRTAILAYCGWASFRALCSIFLGHFHLFRPIRWAFCVPNAAALAFLFFALLGWAVAERDAGSIFGLDTRST